MLAVVATIVSPVASIRCLSGQMDIGSDGAYTPTTIGGVDMSPISVDCDSHSTAAFEATAQDAVATAWADTALGGAITAIGNPYTLLSFTEDDISFDLAKGVCSWLGLHIAKIENPAQLQMASELMEQTGAVAAWIGLNDQAEEGMYRWASDDALVGEMPGFYWGGEPNDWGGAEDCMILNKCVHLQIRTLPHSL
jgi:hypothetical protein